MSMALLRRTDSSAIEWDGDIEVGAHACEEFAAGRAFREDCEALLQCTEGQDATNPRWTRGRDRHDAATKRWIQEERVSRVERAGAEYTATVQLEGAIVATDMTL